MSPKPCVAARTTRAVRPVSSAFVATVVPWKIITTDSGRTPASARAARARSNARPGSAGVDGTFATRTSPPALVAIASVNVPPTSTPTTQPGSATGDVRGKVPDQRGHLLGECPHGLALHVPREAGEVQARDEDQVPARRPPVLIDRAGHLRRGPEDDGLPKRVLLGGGHRRRQPRLAGTAPGAIHVLVLPGHVPAGVPDQIPGVRAIPGEDRQMHADREFSRPPGRLELLPCQPGLLGEQRGADLDGHEPVREPARPPDGGLAHRADPQWRPVSPGRQRPDSDGRQVLTSTAGGEVTAPGTPHRVHAGDHPGNPLREPGTQPLELLLPPAEPDPEDEPSSRDEVGHRRILG